MRALAHLFNTVNLEYKPLHNTSPAVTEKYLEAEELQRGAARRGIHAQSVTIMHWVKASLQNVAKMMWAKMG
jgi:hypothetical protein